MSSDSLNVRSWFSTEMCRSSVRETMLKVVEVVLGFGIVARAACHVAGHLAVHAPVGQSPEVRWRLTASPGVVGVDARTEAVMRAFSMGYGLVGVALLVPVPVSTGAAVGDLALQAVVAVNLLVVAVDPVFFGITNSH